MDETKEVAEGYIVVLAEDYRAANLASYENGAKTGFLGFGDTLNDALLDASIETDLEVDAGCALELVVVEATGELLAEIIETEDGDFPRWYCRTGRARLAR